MTDRLFFKIFRQFLLFNLLFLGLQLSLLMSQGGIFISAIPLPGKIQGELFLTLSIQIGLYFILSLLQSFIVLNLLRKNRFKFSSWVWIGIIWFLTTLTVLAANTYWFPLSLFSKFFYLIPPSVVLILLIGCGFLLILTLITAFLISLRAFTAHRQRGFFILVLTGVSIVVVCLLTLSYNSALIPPKQQVLSQPNIILIGIDSLGPENINPHNMPNLAKMLKNTTLFANTISPLARTYPAWVSILTGLYPAHHRARYNLIAKSKVKNDASIAWALQKKGYQTVFATDDRRFNNLGKEFGFQKIIGPKTGANEILIGSFNDFPLSNLLVNFRLGKWLFPYNYANRASHFLYYPQTFTKNLTLELRKIDTQKPLFLALHFALPHWPYAWAESLPSKVLDEYSLTNRKELYFAALSRVDIQVREAMSFLHHQGYLQNTMLIFLSDHGEALYIPGSRALRLSNYQGRRSQFVDYLKRKTATDLERSAGHGSDLLSPLQYHCLLAFKLYKNNQLINKPATILTRVSLIDITPTIYSYLSEASPRPLDGISLAANLSRPQSPLPQRVFFMESGMMPNQALSKQRARELGRQLFTINPSSGELEIKEEQIPWLNQQKLYAVLSGNWLLALYPDEEKYITIIQKLNTGEWSDDPESLFYKNSKARKLLRQLQDFLPGEINVPSTD